MAVTRGNFATNQNGAGATTLVVTKPASLTNGQVLLASCIVNANTVSFSINAGGTAWIELGTGVGSSGAGNDTLRIFYKVITNAAGEPASYTFNFGATSRKAAGAVVAYNGVDTANPIADWVLSSAGIFNYGSFGVDQGGGSAGWAIEAPLTPVFIAGFVGCNDSGVFTPSGGSPSEFFDITSGGGGSATSKVTFAGYDIADPIIYTYPPSDPNLPNTRVPTGAAGNHYAINAVLVGSTQGMVAAGVLLRASGSAYPGEPLTFDVTTSWNEIVRGAIDYRNDARYMQRSKVARVPISIGNGYFLGGCGFMTEPGPGIDTPLVWTFRSLGDFSGWTDEFSTKQSIAASFGGTAVKLRKINDNGVFACIHSIYRYNSSGVIACQFMVYGHGKVNPSTGAVSVMSTSQIGGSSACSVSNESSFRMSDSQILWLYTHDTDDNGTVQTGLIYREVNPTTGATVTGTSMILDPDINASPFIFGGYHICDLSTTKALVCHKTSAGDLVLRVINVVISPASMTQGALNTLTGPHGSVFQLMGIDSTHAYLTYIANSGAIAYRVLTISGDTVTFGAETELILSGGGFLRQAKRVSTNRYVFMEQSGVTAEEAYLTVYDRNPATNVLSIAGTAVSPLNVGVDTNIEPIDDTHFVLGWSLYAGSNAAHGDQRYIPMAQVLTLGAAGAAAFSDNVGITDSIDVTLVTGYESGLFNPVGLCPWPAGTGSSTLEGYYPGPGIYKTPVQGVNVYNLTAARTPVGRVCLMWVQDGNVSCAILDDYEDTFRNNVVAPANIRNVWDQTGQNRYADIASVWCDGDDLFCAIRTRTTIEGQPNWVRCYMANNAENPTSWAHRGWVWTGTQGGEAQRPPAIVSVNHGGPAHITDAGRWILPMGGWGSMFGDAVDVSALASSADRGLTWVDNWRHRSGAFDSLTTGPISNTIARDPESGYLYWSHYYSPLHNGGWVFRSTDGGVTWAILFTEQTSQGNTWNFYCDDNDATVFAALRSTYWNAWEVDNPANEPGYQSLGIDIINSNYSINNFQFIKLGCVAAVIDNHRVAKAAFGLPPEPSGWLLGRIGGN